MAALKELIAKESTRSTKIEKLLDSLTESDRKTLLETVDAGKVTTIGLSRALKEFNSELAPSETVLRRWVTERRKGIK